MTMRRGEIMGRLSYGGAMGMMAPGTMLTSLNEEQARHLYDWLTGRREDRPEFVITEANVGGAMGRETARRGIGILLRMKEEADAESDAKLPQRKDGGT